MENLYIRYFKELVYHIKKNYSICDLEPDEKMKIIPGLSYCMIIDSFTPLLRIDSKSFCLDSLILESDDNKPDIRLTKATDLMIQSVNEIKTEYSYGHSYLLINEPKERYEIMKRVHQAWKTLKG